MSPSKPDYLSLPREDTARRWFVDEGARFERMLERDLGYATADGGELALPAQTLLHSEQWQHLVDAFLGQRRPGPTSGQ
ncbi:MAG: hypothetical protein HYX76_07875 [Acidobacteria bacterium]|nr:hypothetical protein [Acidobacteriota bacterium]